MLIDMINILNSIRLVQTKHTLLIMCERSIFVQYDNEILKLVICSLKVRENHGPKLWNGIPDCIELLEYFLRKLLEVSYKKIRILTIFLFFKYFGNII